MDEVYHGICYRKFPVIPPQIMIPYQCYGDQDVKLPEKFVELLKEKYKKFDRIFEFVYCRDNSRKYHSIAIQHSAYDKFDYDRGVSMAEGRLNRLMGKGYLTYKQNHHLITYPDGKKIRTTTPHTMVGLPDFVVRSD